MTSINSVAQYVASQDRREGTKIAGRWHNLQIKPDLGSSEILNVGVAFVDEARNVHLKLARDLSRLTCLYDDRVDVRSFERLCAVIEGAYNGSALDGTQPASQPINGPLCVWFKHRRDPQHLLQRHGPSCSAEVRARELD